MSAYRGMQYRLSFTGEFSPLVRTGQSERRQSCDTVMLSLVVLWMSKTITMTECWIKTGFLPQSTNMHARLTGESKLTIRVGVRLFVLFVLPSMDCQPIQGVPRLQTLSWINHKTLMSGDFHLSDAHVPGIGGPKNKFPAAFFFFTCYKSNNNSLHFRAFL